MDDPDPNKEWEEIVNELDDNVDLKQLLIRLIKAGCPTRGTQNKKQNGQNKPREHNK